MIFNYIFPKKCVGCKSESGYFCKRCKGGIVYRGGVVKLDGLGGLDGLVSVFGYRGVIKGAIKKFKFSYITDLFDELMELVIKDLYKSRKVIKTWKREKFVIVSVPLHKSRLRWRGFNQAEKIGKRLSDKLGLVMNNDLLIRVKKTKAQSEIKQVEKRMDNIKGAFKAKGNLPINVLLVDDVWTSGTTMKECAMVLKLGGVKRVWGMTVAA